MPDTATGTLDGILPTILPSPEALALMRRIDELHLNHPFAGAKMLSRMLKRGENPVGRRHVTTLMERMGTHALYRRLNTSKHHQAHPVYARRRECF